MYHVSCSSLRKMFMQLLFLSCNMSKMFFLSNIQQVNVLYCQRCSFNCYFLLCIMSKMFVLSNTYQVNVLSLKYIAGQYCFIDLFFLFNMHHVNNVLFSLMCPFHPNMSNVNVNSQKYIPLAKMCHVNELSPQICLMSMFFLPNVSFSSKYV